MRNLVSLDERTARLNAGLVYVSLMGVLDFYQSDPVDLDLEASPALCAQLPLLEVETHLGDGFVKPSVFTLKSAEGLSVNLRRRRLRDIRAGRGAFFGTRSGLQ